MELSTSTRFAVRSFADAGVDALERPARDPIPPARLSARIVRDGQVYPIPLDPGGPSSPRMAANAAALFVVVLCIGLSALAVGPMTIGYRPVVVASGSMEPSLRVADVVVAKAPNADNVDVGTVIDATTERGSRIHRVVEVLPEGYRTKGDANAHADSDIVAVDDVNGVGVFLVPFVGLPRVWLDSGQWYKLASLVVVFVAAAFCSRNAWLQPRRRLVAIGRVERRLPGHEGPDATDLIVAVPVVRGEP